MKGLDHMAQTSKLFLAAALVGPIYPLAAQSCIGKIVPLKPASVMCSNAAPSCVCAAMACRWIWGCPAQPPARQAAPDPAATAIPLMYRSPKIDPVEPYAAAAAALAARKAQLENERLQIENEKAKRSTEGSSAAASPAPSAGNAGFTHGNLNGYAWRDFTGSERSLYVQAVAEAVMMTAIGGNLSGAGDPADTVRRVFPLSATSGEIVARIDYFYTDAANLPVPLNNLMMLIAAEARGVDSTEIQKALLGFRETAK